MEGHPHLRSLLATGTVPSAATASTTENGVRAFTGPPPPEPVDPNITTNVSSIVFRVILISFMGIIAIWANHEASKGFSVMIVNDACKHSSGKRFSLFYESNNKATQIVLNTSRFVENLLYPNDHQDHFLNSKKQINGDILRFAPTNFPAMVVVDSQKPHEYIISLSASVLMETSNNNEAVVLAVLHGMARVWLWDGKGAAPLVLLNGMVEYISSLAGFTVRKSGGGATIWPPENNEICWKDGDPRRVAGFLRYCDGQSKQRGGGGGGGGEVIRRLNERMSNSWHDWMMDDALGMAGHHACASYDMMMRRLNPSSSM